MARSPSPKPVEVPEAAVQTKEAPKKIQIQPVYGRMVHMHTAQEIVGVVEVDEIDPWLQAQIDAGKIVVV